MARHAWQMQLRQRTVNHLQVVHRMSFERLDATPMEIAKVRASRLPPDHVEELFAPMRAAFVAFRAGHGNNFHWRKLVDANNVAMELAKHHRIANDHKDTFAAAEAALAAVAERHAHGGSWTLRGTEIAALDLAVQVHRIQLMHVTHGELGEAVTSLKARIQAALRGDHAPGVLVIDPDAPTSTNATQAAA